MDGNHKFLRGNVVSNPWRQMQRELNVVLDRIADKGDNPSLAAQVQAMSMKDGTDADFRSLFGDLFGERMLDPTNGAWSNKDFYSFTLPEFL